MTVGTAYASWSFAHHAGASAASWKWVALFSMLAVLLVLELSSLALSWSRRRMLLVRALEALESSAGRARIPGSVLAVLLLAVFPLLVTGPTGVHLMDLYARLALFGVLTLAGGTILRGVRLLKPWTDAVIAYGLALGVVYRVVVFFPEVSTFPLSLGWSEGSRFYFASLFFAERIYGVDVPWPVLHPSRYLLQSIPFLVPGLPLWAQRLWQVLLWLGMTGLGALLVIRRLGPLETKRRWMLSGWAFLFFFQAPVYYHLMVCVLIVLWGFDSGRFRRSLLVVMIASVWAGISRVNWFPVPGMIAGLIYLLERSFPNGWRRVLGYLAPPAGWMAAGLVTAIASGLAYASLSENALGRFGSSFTSDLLWYRLLPNATYGPGILKAIFIVTLPSLLWLVASVRRSIASLHPLRMAALGATLLALFAEGIFVSVKIGGGGDLHNLDAFVTGLLLVLAYAMANRVSLDRGEPVLRGMAARWAVVLVLLAPAFWVAPLGGPPQPRDEAEAWRAVSAIREALEPVVERAGRVLFLSERHLVTFGLVGEVGLEPDYEKTFLMEMVMSRNSDYLNAFYRDLQGHEFDVIVTARPAVRRYGRQHRFGEEDTVWSDAVAAPLLQYYRPAIVLQAGDLWLMVPAVDGEGAGESSSPSPGGDVDLVP